MGAAEINYAALVPDKPQTDVVEFARQEGAFQAEYLVYQMGRYYEPLEDCCKSAVRVCCTACGGTFYADKVPVTVCNPKYAPVSFGWLNTETREFVISGTNTRCPLCGAEAKTVHTGQMRFHGGEIVDDACVTELSRLSVDGKRDRLVLTDWMIRRCVNKDADVRYEVWPYSAWVVEERKIVRLIGFVKFMNSIRLLGHWEQRKTYRDVYGCADLVAHWDPQLLEGTTAEHCKLDLYQEVGGARLVSYLALWRRHPNVENLMVQGCGGLVDQWLRQETESVYFAGGVPKLEAVDWKQRRPSAMLGLDREELRQLRREEWSIDDLRAYKLTRDAGVPARLPENMDLLRCRPFYEIDAILKESPKSEFWRVLRYLKKQKAGWPDLRDYWRMAREDGLDLTEGLVRWPRDLSAKHRQQIMAREAEALRQRRDKEKKKQAERASLFAARLEALASLAYEADGLLIRPCANEQELIAEGGALHHCVATYAQSHADGKTAILFVRRSEAPEESYYTLELDEHQLTVRQNRGKYNCARTPEVQAFEDKWLAWVRAGAPRDKNGEPILTKDTKKKGAA